MKLKEIMTPNPLVLRSDHTIREAASLFVQHRIDSAPVAASDGELRGLFTNRHINRAVSQSLDMEAPVESLMNREVNTIGSKVADAELRWMAVEAKAVLEKIREQVQNVE